ncbi:leucine-rich repeat-containing protein 74B-like [Silurus asotus]|uniref:Leucine-rich repeat-containing protein 74B-like n=1 Tax=Silurus asotus TaxID=30991 RepID=A0AAD5AAP1_SILAS|nr:leucine-rich repeat-containing protein 74B-like [Silurus asotus]
MVMPLCTTFNQSRTGKRTPTYFHRLALDSVISSKGSLVLLNGPNAIEVHKPRKLSQQNYLKEKKESRKSNVLVTMLYLGHGKLGTTQDEMKVLQQKCGGENICVFKGSVQPGEQFQFISQRHLGYPFSVTFYVNGIIAGRISSCCDMESCRSSPLFIPVGMERYVQRTRKLSKDSSKVLTDSEDMNDCMTDKKRSKRQNKRYVQQQDSKGSEASQDKRDTREDETKSTLLNSQIPILEKSINVKEHGKDKPKASNVDPGGEYFIFNSEFERNKLREQLTVVPHPNDSATELELSEESENNAAHLKSEKPSTDLKTQGVHVLLDLLQAKSEIKGLLLFGNHLGDAGVQMLLSGIVELQEKTAAASRLPLFPKQFTFSVTSFALIELDLGGNGIGSEGLKVLGTFMRYHSKLEYLGLAQSCCSSMEAWYVFFESLGVNNKLTHIILDENSLGDQGVKLFAEALQINESLQKIDLDRNNFGEVGGNALFEAVSRSQCCLKHLSLEDNYISTALMSKFQEAMFYYWVQFLPISQKL